MKTYQIKDLLKKEIMLIELPENGNTFDDLTFLDSETEGYTLLGKPSEIREEDAKELVESWESVAKDGTMVYENYKGIPKKRTATESLLSAIETVVLWENPYAEPDKFIDSFDNLCYEWWQDAELRTFDRNRSIILVKN